MSVVVLLDVFANTENFLGLFRNKVLADLAADPCFRVQVY